LSAVPLICPVSAARLSPVGSEPWVILNEYGGAPPLGLEVEIVPHFIPEVGANEHKFHT